MENLIGQLHLHPVIDHFTIALLGAGVAADVLASLLLTRLSDRSPFLKLWRERLSATAVHLLIGGALAAMLSCFTGEREAERLWDTMSPAAQHLLWSDSGAQRLRAAHAMIVNQLSTGLPLIEQPSGRNHRGGEIDDPRPAHGP